MSTTITVPDDFGSGGKGIAPNSAPKGTATLAEILQALIGTGLGSKFQSGSGTLVAGTFTVSAGIELTANSRIVVSHDGRPTGSANYAGLAVTTRTPGASGVAAFTVEALIADGTIDSDAAGDVDWIIID